MAFCTEHPERDQNPKFYTPKRDDEHPHQFHMLNPPPPLLAPPGCIVPASMEVEVIVASLPFFWEIFPRVSVSSSPPSSKIDQHPKFHVPPGSEEKCKAAGLSGSSWNFQVSPSQNIVSLDEIDTCIYMSTSSKD